MKNIYTPEEINAILEATIGREDSLRALNPDQRDRALQRRDDFVVAVGEAVAREVLRERDGADRPVIVFAGDTINGAYAVETARALHLHGCPAHIYLINIASIGLGNDCLRAVERFYRDADPEALSEIGDMKLIMPLMGEDTIVVDGIFGREYGKALRGGYQVMARSINEQAPTVVSIDVPSGMGNDLDVGMINRNIVHASLTLTLVGPSLAFYMPENAELLGRWKTLALPLDREALKSCNCRSRLTDAWGVESILPERPPLATKADLGGALIFAGSYGMVGASVLCARAALRSGCGKVTVHGPRCAFPVVQTAVPAAMFETDGADNEIRRFESVADFDAVAAGPGIGHAETTIDGLETFLKKMYAAKYPVVLDADALNCIAARPSLLDHIPVRSVITPHAGEFDRIFGRQPSASARLLRAMEVARNYRIVVVLKSHYTQTVWPDGSVVVNNSGTDALATAGSGDVLTGILTGLMAQGMHPELAAVAAVYIHGVAGELAAREHGRRGTTADDIAEAVGAAIESVLGSSAKPKNRKTKD